MIVEDLEVGKIYRCRLASKHVLVIMTEPQTTPNIEGVDNVIEPTKAGKSVVRLDNGDYKYVYTELHDGQLEEIKNN